MIVHVRFIRVSGSNQSQHQVSPKRNAQAIANLRKMLAQ
jgi:hypothetical protein